MNRSRIALLALLVAFLAATFILSRCQDETPDEGDGSDKPEVVYPRDRPDPVVMRKRGRKQQGAADAPLDTQRSPREERRARDRLEAAMSDGSGGGTVFVELNAIRHSPVAERIMKCRQEEALRAFDDIRERLGIDPREDIDRVALSGNGVAISGFFSDLKVPEEIGEAKTYGDKARMWSVPSANVDAEGARPGEDMWVAVVGDDVIVSGSSQEEVQAAVDRVEGRAEAPPLPRVQGQRGEIYGAFGAPFVASLLGDAQDPLSRRLGELVQGGVVRMNIDEHVSMSLDLEASDPAVAKDLAQAVGGAFAAARLKAQEEGRPEVAQLLEQARVKPRDDGRFDVDVAVPGEVILEALGCDAEGNPKGSNPGALRGAPRATPSPALQPSAPEEEGAEELAPDDEAAPE